MNNENKLREQDPIVLCHAACSGGSLIYRMIIANFDLTGISEVSHRYPFKCNSFIPTDPEHALLENGAINNEEFEDIFFSRILNANEITRKKNKPLLIREHSHSYFFTDAAKAQTLNTPSWIVDQYHKRLSKQIKCIITVRDPIDSWLGLVANFPGNTPASFQEYSARYEIFIQTLVHGNDQQHMLLVKYEDLIEDQEHELQRIAKFIGVPFNEMATNNWSQVSSTGNSGRQDDKIQKRTRRPFGTQLIRDASTSESYRNLIEELGYVHLSDSVTIKVRIRSYYIDFRKKFAKGLSRILAFFQRWALSRLRMP